MENFNIQEELKKLPGKPGVYLMHDERDAIIYVGKAISLKNRVRQYFQSSRNKGAKIEQMVTHISRFEYIVTDSELEALVLECNLIKEHQRAGNLLHATQIVSKVQKRCMHTKNFHSQCNAISQISKKELFLCRDSPKNIAKQEKIATLSPKKHKKDCMA